MFSHVYVVDKVVLYWISPKSFVPSSRDHIIYIPIIEWENQGIPAIVCVSHPVSRNFRIHFPDIPSIKALANTVSRKRPAGPLFIYTDASKTQATLTKEL